MNCANDTYVERLGCKLQSNGRKYVVCKGQIFSESGGIVSADIPAAEGTLLHPRDCRDLLQKLGGKMVRWTGGFTPGSQPGGWYSVICRNFVPVESKPHKKRAKAKSRLKDCEVRMIPAEELAATGYRVHLQALKRYRGAKISIPAEEEFRHNVAREKAFPDLTHNWGIYYKGVLAGYAQNHVIGQTEAYYSTIKLDPDYFDYSPGYALIYRMNEYYLGQCGFQYVNDGYKTIWHETNMQTFLMDHFGFEKAYTRLHVHYRAPMGLLMLAAYPWRKWLGRLDGRMAALFEQERCRRLA